MRTGVQYIHADRTGILVWFYRTYVVGMYSQRGYKCWDPRRHWQIIKFHSHTLVAMLMCKVRIGFQMISQSTCDVIARRT